MKRQVSDRRRFFGEMVQRVACWSAPLGLLGLRLHTYANPAAVGWKGWITFYGRLVGFVRPNGVIHWWSKVTP